MDGLDWMDGSLGLVEYRAPYGANNGCSTKSESFRFYVIVQPVCRKNLTRFCSCEKMSWWLTLILGGSDVSFVNIFKANEYWINKLSAYNSESLCKMFVRKQEILAKQIPVFWFNSLMPVAWNKNRERESSRINISSFMNWYSLLLLVWIRFRQI